MSFFVVSKLLIGKSSRLQVFDVELDKIKVKEDEIAL